MSAVYPTVCPTPSSLFDLRVPSAGGRPSGHPSSGSAVVCFPPAGAGASCYRFLPTALGGTLGREARSERGRPVLPKTDVLSETDDLLPQVFSVQYPGRGTHIGEPAAVSRAALVSEAAAAIAAVLGPALGSLILLGHSLGALVAFETALVLGPAGIPPRGVVLSARAAHPVRGVGTTQPDYRTATRSELLDWLFSLGGTPAEVIAHPELSVLSAEALRADLAVSADPESEGRMLRAPVLVLVGDADPAAPVLVLVGDADPAVPVATCGAWQSRTSGPAAVRVLRGDHNALRTDLSWLPDLIALATAAPDGLWRASDQRTLTSAALLPGIEGLR